MVTILTIAIIGVSALVFGCTSPSPTPTTGSVTPAPTGPTAAPVPTWVPPAGLSGELTVTGSTSVGPYAEELATMFDAKNNGKTSTGVSQTGSGPGIKAVTEGTTMVGMSSRELTADETSKGLVAKEICLDGIAIIVNKANPVSNLTIDQIRDVYAGNVTNWKQLGGEDAQIIVVTREAGSGTRSAFEELVMKKMANITTTAVQQSSTGAISTYVSGNKYAIGYISYGSLDPAQVNAIAVNGVKPSVATIKDKSYPIQRPFLLVTKGEPAGLAKAYIDFVMSPEGQSYLTSKNLVSVS